MKLVSVVIPTYNTPYDFLKIAVESITKQTYENLEIIIVDDASTTYNDSGEINKIIESDPRIKLIKNDRSKGVAGALNTGILSSKGEYIVRMDADDISVKNRIEKQVKFLEEHPDISILAGYTKDFGASKKWFKPCCDNISIKTTLLFNSALAHPSICIRSGVLKEKGYLYSEEVQSEDYELWTRCAVDENIKFANLPELVLNYRVHQDQVSKTNFKVMCEQGECIRKNYLKKLGISLTDEQIETFVRYAMLVITKSSLKQIIEIQNAVEKQLSKNIIFSGEIYKKIYRKILVKKALSHIFLGDIRQIVLFVYNILKFVFAS